MVKFSLRQLHSQGAELGQFLAQTRTAKNISLSEASRKLKLPIKYLEAMEKGALDQLPAGDYGRYFLRRYLEYLGVETEAILQQYDSLKSSAGSAASFKQKVEAVKVKNITLSPKPFLRRLLLILIALAVAGYLVSTAVNTFLPPKLSLISPQDNLSTQSPVLAVTGLTEVGVELSINGEQVEVSNQGRFDRQVALRPGLNTITVSASKSYSRTRTITRLVLFNPPNAGSSNNSMVP